jgi:hypothetical protein
MLACNTAHDRSEVRFGAVPGRGTGNRETEIPGGGVEPAGHVEPVSLRVVEHEHIPEV